jgi:hypothetical protein
VTPPPAEAPPRVPPAALTRPEAEAPHAGDQRRPLGLVSSLPKSVLIFGLLLDALVVVVVVFILGHRL